MSKFDRTSLLRFLRKPRCLHEIARHFEVPTKLADYHLHAAIKSGAVLVYRKQIPQEIPNSNAKQLRLKGFLYISRSSPVLAKELAAINSIPKTRSPSTLKSIDRSYKSSAFSTIKLIFLHNLMAYLKLDKAELFRILHDLSHKMKLAKSKRRPRPLKWKTSYGSAEPKSLLHIEKIRLFQSLSNEPLPFLEIRRHFSISKQVVEGFVKRGLFEEVWGPNDIGVKFKLTEKGETHLKELKKASEFEHQQLKKIVIQLKHRIFS